MKKTFTALAFILLIGCNKEVTETLNDLSVNEYLSTLSTNYI